jgi:ABC-2 type transport system permease protein
MSRDIRALLYYFMADYRFSLTVFWSILLSSIVLLFIIALSFGETMVGVSSSLAIYIFCAISGFLMTKETFPFCIKLGSTRNSYVVSAFIFNVLTAVFMATIHLVASLLVRLFAKVANVDNFNYFFTLDGTTIANTWYNQLMVDSLICFMLLSVGFLLSSIVYRLGLVGGLGSIAILGLAIILPQTRNVLIDTFVTVNQVGIDLRIMPMLLVSLIVLLPTWALLRNASTAPGITR